MSCVGVVRIELWFVLCVFGVLLACYVRGSLFISSTGYCNILLSTFVSGACVGLCVRRNVYALCVLFGLVLCIACARCCFGLIVWFGLLSDLSF